MANDIRLQEGHPVDENLRPLKINNISSCLELSQSENGSGARFTGDLEILGNIPTVNTNTIRNTGSNSIFMVPAGSDASVYIGLTDSPTIRLNVSEGGLGGGLRLFSVLDQEDHCTIGTGINGVTTIRTVDAGAEGADLILNIDGYIDMNSASGEDITLDSGGTIKLDSADGTFEMLGAGSTAKFADMYAGMILGYTDIGLNESHATLDLTTAYVVPTDEFSVSFVAPPSGNVRIDFQIRYYMGSTGAGTLHAGLSTANATTGYSPLQSYHEQVFDDTGSRNGIATVHGSWTITGLTAGTATEYWIGFKTISTAGTTANIQWGGSGTGRYPSFIMKATALPATITT